jgi:hypothetical protein
MSYNKMSQEQWKDAFINNNLSVDDHAMFQDLINANPELKEEILMEESLKDVACEARKKEMKAHLSTLEVEPTNMFFNMPRATLIGSIMVASIMTSVLVYFDAYKEQHIFNTNTKIEVAYKGNKEKNNFTKDNNKKDNNTENNTVFEKNNSQDDLRSDKNVNVSVPLAETNTQNVTNTQTMRFGEKDNISEIKNNKNTAIPTNKLVIMEPLDIAVSSINRPINQKAITLASLKSSSNKNSNSQNVNNQNIETNELLTYQIQKKDSDLGIFDGKHNKTLENDQQGHRLLYQYYGGKLFIFSKNVRGRELHLDEKGGNKRHFLYYDKQFYEFFDNQVEKSELKPVNQPELIDRLKKELLNRN